MGTENTIREELLGLIRKEKWDLIPSRFTDIHPADIAEIINDAPETEHAHLFSLIEDEKRPEVLSELTSLAGEDVVDGLGAGEVAVVLEQTAPDDAADFLSELPDESSNEILRIMNDDDAAELRTLMRYDEESAGGIMNPDLVAMQQDQSVEEAIRTIVDFDTEEPVFYANVIDKNGVLVGYANIWELLREKNRATPIGELVHTSYVTAHTDMDQEEVIHLMSKYDLTSIPVVDENGRLVGRVTADDALEVQEEEASEDIFKLAGSDDIELEDTSVLKTCLVRLPWLLVTLFGGFIVSLILRQFHTFISGNSHVDAETLALAAFVPTVLAMGGNAGIQSSTLVVRSLAVDGHVRRGVFRMLAREIAVGALMGCCCGLLIGTWAGFITANGAPMAHGIRITALQLSLIVSAALLCTMSFATFFGASVPMILDRLDIDPAVASGPFVTIANDVSALLIYFAATAMLIRIFAGG